MKIDKDNLITCVENAKQCLISRQQNIVMNNNTYLTWPLFFHDNADQNFDVDVCTSALGVITLSKFNLNNNDSIKVSVNRSINTLISIRNDNGSWPSNISLISKEELFMEGVISDTCFALSALLSVGFLSNNPMIDSFTNLKTGTQLNSIDDRIEYVNESVNWLLSNRVNHNQGWQYTGIGYLEKTDDKDALPAYTTPTANAIIILSQIVEVVKDLRPDHSMVNAINNAIYSSVEWFRDIQSSHNGDYGFGIKRGERSRIGNTSRVIIALCTASNTNGFDIEKNLYKAVKWMIKEYKPNKLHFSDVGEDFDQLIIEKENGLVKNAYRRSIYHETFIEAHLIDSLRLYYHSNYNKNNNYFLKVQIFSTISKALNYLINQQSHGGLNDGAVLSRRTTANEKYTMYSTSNYICTLMDLCNDDTLLSKVKHCTLRNVLLFGGTVLFITGSVILALLFESLKFWITVPIGIVLSIAANYLSEKFL